MKRYIKASIASSCPDWLKKSLTRSKYGPDIKQKLLDRYHIALDKANFTDHPTSSTAVPIYLLQSDYGTVIYCPGANDDETAYFNKRNRRLGAIAKSRLPELAVDVVYVDPKDPANTFSLNQYQDPRRTYRYNSKSGGSYAGQYYNDYRNEWSKTGMTPANESRPRDKSGYRIPSPAEMLSKYYKKFPEKLRSKVDSIYERILDVKQALMDADLNTPVESPYGRDAYSDAYRRFSDVIYEYRRLFSYFDDQGKFKEMDFIIDGDAYYISEFSSKVRDISRMLNEIEKTLGM